MGMDSKKKRAGRPPTMNPEQRKAFILEKAEKLYLECGYSSTSMEDIAKACKISKKTLYQVFSNKSELFQELLESVSIDNKEPISRQLIKQPSSAKFRQVFLELTRFALSSRQLEMTRLVISEAKTNRILARQYHEDIIINCRNIISKKLKELQISAISDSDLDMCSELLIGAIIAPLQLKLLIGAEDFDEAMITAEKRLEAIISLMTELSREGKEPVEKSP